jgi:hypothetical protein
MKKNMKLFIALAIILLITNGFTFVISSKKNNFYEESTDNIKKRIIQENTLSMMLETEAGSGNYEMTTASNWPTDGYVFNTTLSKCENGGELSWDDENKRVVMSGNVSDKCYVYFDKVLTLATYVKSLYTGTQGDNNIYYHDSTLANGAGDNSYRYAGASETTNNYVCFGSTESPCPTDNLYRIIGVFNGKVKLVKYNDIGTFDTSKYDATSFADTEAYNALNSTFIDTFDIRWKNMISTENWISGIVSSSSVSKLNFKNNNTNVKFLAGSATSPLTINWYTAKNWYIVESGAEHKLSMKIGTISISELRYAMNSSNWNLSTLDNTSWLYYNKNEAFYLFECFTDNVANDAYGYYMTTDGILYAYYSPTKISLLEDITTYVRPSFYLTSSVLYKSGIGTSSDAIYITD